MTGTSVIIQSLFDCRDTSLVGGKAANLGRLLRTGFSVPEGFVVTTCAYRSARTHAKIEGIPSDMPHEVAEEIRLAYRAMGGGAVAVRSSATAEDAAAASMAGQYETILNIEGETPLLDAVRRCWESLNAPRARAYLHEQRIDPDCVEMAVVVQRLVPADVAGVLFTVNPHNGWHREMLLEASWGLGEAVVSGQVQPDALRLDRETGKVLAATIADKHVLLAAGAGETQPVDESCRRRPCLGGRDVHRLWQLGKRIVEHFRSPQDIEWAIHDEEIYVLQSRPITTLREIEAYEEILRGTRRHLQRESAAERGPWVLHNLAETLAHPTPLSWSVIKRFMSGAGGFGAMYRQAGFQPSPAVARDGFLELIAGCIYMDASRAPEMFFENFPFTYDLEELTRSPGASQTPPTLPRGSLASRIKIGRRLAAVNAKLHALSAVYDRQIHDGLFPEISSYVADAKRIDLGSLSGEQLIECWRKHEMQVLDVFGAQLLLPSLIGAVAIADLRQFIAENFWDEDPDALVYLISSGGDPDRTVVADAELYELAKGTRPLETWLADHGHRAANEFDLAAPRWREQPLAVCNMAGCSMTGDNPLERYSRHRDTVNRRIEELRKNLSCRCRVEFDRLVELVRRYIGFREDGKDFLMLGYDLLRDLALEAGRRLEVGQDVFFLAREELFDALRVGFAPFHFIERQKNAYRAENRLKLPRVIEKNSIDALGNAPEKEPAAGGRQGFAVSAGEASGPVRILASPTDAGDLGRGYILVCPGTDPSWTPLFAGAAGLVLERGGMLSHGAVVAREMGLPAVVLPDAMHLFREGEEIRVDGNRGWVGKKADVSRLASRTEIIDPNDVYITPNLVPPPPGRKDRRAARFGIGFGVVWTVYLLAVFLLPERWLYQFTLSALDFPLWPIVRAWGKPSAVAIIAASMAVLTLIVQKLVTDNRRLMEAKRRAAALNKISNALPLDSPRRAVVQRLAAPVQLRALSAAMVPIGILLGPMVLSFAWLKERVDPSVWNAPAGSAVTVVATVKSDWNAPIRMVVPQPAVVDDATPSVRTLPPLRKTLERLLALYRQPRNDPSVPWELKAAPDLAREQTADNLQAYLTAGIPPQSMTWTIRLPDDMSGRFPVSVSTAGRPPLMAMVVLGEDYPPAPLCTKNADESPLKELRVVYPKPKVEPVFWKPLACLIGNNQIPFAGWLATIKIGWLLLYIVVYLPTLMLVKIVLKVA